MIPRPSEAILARGAPTSPFSFERVISHGVGFLTAPLISNKTLRCAVCGGIRELGPPKRNKAKKEKRKKILIKEAADLNFFYN